MPAQITILENGLRVVSDHIPGVQTATLGAWIGVGSRSEHPSENGVSHFLEHMAFKGTETRTAAQIATEIENVGGYLNAYTSRENTAYHARVLAENVPLATEIIADILQNSTFMREEVEKERTVILQEIHQSNDTPDDIVFDYFQESAFPNQPLGRPILGPEDIVSNMTPEVLRGYMHKHYHSPTMVFVATGGVDHDHLVDLCEAQFTSLTQNEKTPLEPAKYQNGQRVEVRDLEQVHMLVGFESVKQGHPDYFATAVLSSILGGGMSSRLFQEVRESRGLVYSVYSFNSAFRDTGLFGIYAGTGEDKMAEIMPVISGILQSFDQDLTHDEILRSKTQLKAGLLMGLESTTARCEQLAQHMLIYGRQMLPEEIMAKVDAVSHDDIVRVANKLFTSPPTYAAIGPGGVEAHLKL